MKIKMSSIAFFFALILMLSCSKSDPAPVAVDCSALSKKVSDAVLAYASAPSVATCNAYVAALKELIDKASSCGAVITAAQLADFKQEIANTKCQ
jgi:hypothetical protein